MTNPIQHEPGEIFIDKDGNKHRCVEDGASIILGVDGCSKCSFSGWKCKQCELACIPSMRKDGKHIHYERVEE